MKPRVLPALALIATTLATSAGAAPARPQDGAPRQVAASDARTLFALAVDLQRAARRREGAERRALLLQVARTYQALRNEHPDAAELVAEAGLRAASVFASIGADDCALAEYEAACSFETPALWRARAWLERGHFERRENRLDSALDAYLRAASVEGGARRTRDDAALWAAKTHLLARELEPARRLLAWLVENTTDVFVRIRAYDEWALSYVRAGDAAAAAGVLELCRSATREVAFEATPRGERVLLALERMRCIAAMERAVRDATRSRSDE